MDLLSWLKQQTQVKCKFIMQQYLLDFPHSFSNTNNFNKSFVSPEKQFLMTEHNANAVL